MNSRPIINRVVFYWNGRKRQCKLHRYYIARVKAIIPIAIEAIYPFIFVRRFCCYLQYFFALWSGSAARCTYSKQICQTLTMWD